MNRTATSTVSPVPVLILVILVAAGLGACSRKDSLAFLERESTASAVADPAAVAESPAEREAIRQSLRDFTSEVRGADIAAELQIMQIGIDSDYALTTWLRGESGGQAVLHKDEGGWKVLDRRSGWYGLKGLRKVKVPAEVAKRLLDEVDPNWVSYEARL